MSPATLQAIREVVASKVKSHITDYVMNMEI